MNVTTTARTARTRKIRVTERQSLQVVREVPPIRLPAGVRVEARNLWSVALEREQGNRS